MSFDRFIILFSWPCFQFSDGPFDYYRIKLRPRVLRNVSQQDISVTVLGQKLSMPICVSPVSFQAMAHPDGELATVRGKLAGNSAVL